MLRTVIAAAFVAVIGLAAPGLASPSKQVHYVGIHPIPTSEGGGICYIEGPHVHMFEADKVQYRDHRGASYFVGDPVAYGYDGTRYAYKGHHPIHVSAVVGYGEPHDEYCYLNGPHYHYFAPPDGPEFQRAGDAYFYVGEPPRAYVAARPAMMRINAVYQPLVYERPVVTVEAPVGWIGARAELVGPGAVVETRGAVVAPGAGVSIEAAVPLPSVHVEIGVGAPGVIIHERGPAVIVRDRPVIVHERPVIVRERRVIIEDHGKHKHEAGNHR